MACGLSIKKDHLDRFKALFAQVCERGLTPQQMARVTLTDGQLHANDVSVQTAKSIEEAGPWGQGFEEPLFEGSFKIKSVRTMGTDHQHARYQVQVGNREVTAVHFNAGEGVRLQGSTIDMTYRLNVNRWRGAESLQLIADEVA